MLVKFVLWEYDPAPGRQHLVIGREHRDVELEQAADFHAWAAEHWPAPRWRAQMLPGQMPPALRWDG